MTPMDVYWLEQTQADVPEENQWLSAREAHSLSGMRFARRRADWRLGRWTAKRALAACLNLPNNPYALAAIEIRAAASGAPEVFLPGRAAVPTISLSHRAGTALCAVAPPGTSLGCDLEMIEAHTDAFVADYFTVRERLLVRQASGIERSLLVALLWSGKESALKALHEGLRLDTNRVEVKPGDASSQQGGGGLRNAWPPPRLSARPAGWRPLGVSLDGATAFYGWWRNDDDMVRTVVATLPICSPAALGCGTSGADFGGSEASDRLNRVVSV